MRRRRLPGVSTAEADAVRSVNAAYYRLPHEHRADPPLWTPLDRELDASCAAGDRDRALAAIRAWRGFWLAKYDSALDEPTGDES